MVPNSLAQVVIGALEILNDDDDDDDEVQLFLVSHFNFLFVPCGRLSWLSVSFLLHVKYTLSYRIVRMLSVDM